MTRLRDIWHLLCELFSGRLLRRLRATELAVGWQLEHHERWEQELVKLRGFATSKTQALTRDIGAIKLDMVKLTVRVADSKAPPLMPIEQAITFEDDEETEILWTDSKT